MFSDQDDILDKHNEYRRAVSPPAANMLKMVREFYLQVSK